MAQFTLIALGLSVILALAIGVVAWRQRPQPGTMAFSVGMAGLTWLLGCMLIGNGATVLYEASEISFVFLRLKWIGTNLMALGWFFFALDYTGREEYVNRRVVVIASIIPVIAAVLLLANDRLIEVAASFVGLSLTLPSFDLWIHLERIIIAYIYALIFAGSILIVGMILAHQLPHPEQAGLWILAISVPFAVNVTYLSGILAPLGTPEISVDPTPLAFLLTGTVGLAAILRYDSFDKAPIARSYVVNEIRMGVLVYDEDCRIVDHNQWVTETLDLPADAVGQDVRQILAATIDLDTEETGSPQDAAELAEYLQGREIRVDGEASTHLNIDVTPLERREGLPIGYSVLFYDVTAQKRYQRELEDSNQRLAYERDLKERIRDTLINTSTQSELEQAFCNSSIEDQRVLAWVGEETAPGEVSIRTSASNEEQLPIDESYPDTTSLAEQAIETGETIVITDLATGESDEGEMAASTDLRSGIAIPLVYNDLNYGVFCVFATVRNAFEPREQALLEDTAESLAYSLHAAVQRESLRSEEPMRVAFEIQADGTNGDVTSSYLGALAEGTVPAEGTIEISEIQSEANGDATHILSSTNVPPEAISEAIASHDSVLSIDPMGDEQETTALTVTVETPTLQSEIVELGGAVSSTTVNDGRIRVESEFSRRADLEGILERLQEIFPDIELASRVYVDRSEGSAPSRSQELTEKQLDALRTAYVSGFFHRPQRATANEVADALGVSRTTFLHHLRAAERNLFDTIFNEETELTE